MRRWARRRRLALDPVGSIRDTDVVVLHVRHFARAGPVELIGILCIVVVLTFFIKLLRGSSPSE
jgi:hypothetical protein